MSYYALRVKESKVDSIEAVRSDVFLRVYEETIRHFPQRYAGIMHKLLTKVLDYLRNIYVDTENGRIIEDAMFADRAPLKPILSYPFEEAGRILNETTVDVAELTSIALHTLKAVMKFLKSHSLKDLPLALFERVKNELLEQGLWSFYTYLPHGDYRVFEIEDRKYIVALKRHDQMLSIYDFNGVLFTTSNPFTSISCDVLLYVNDYEVRDEVAHKEVVVSPFAGEPEKPLVAYVENYDRDAFHHMISAAEEAGVKVNSIGVMWKTGSALPLGPLASVRLDYVARRLGEAIRQISKEVKAVDVTVLLDASQADNSTIKRAHAVITHFLHPSRYVYVTEGSEVYAIKLRDNWPAVALPIAEREGILARLLAEQL